MTVSNLADLTAAGTAGYVVTRLDRGAALANTSTLRYLTRISKPTTGAPADSIGNLFEATGESSVSAAAADTSALASLNSMRQHRYGGSPGRATGSAESATARGGVQTVDLS